MKSLVKSLLPVFMILCAVLPVCADETKWQNNLRTQFLNNQSVIMEVNIRSFNSNDKDGDGFIQEDRGEQRGTFLNAIDRLDEIKNLGINTLHVLPITPTGKLKALGTAGSLYSASSLEALNEDLYDKNSTLTLDEQAKKFIDEAHKRGISIIVDVPACASYDLFLERPDLFVTSASGEPVIPSDWTDVRLLAVGTEEKIDPNTYSLYKDFVKHMLKLGVDGIRADVAHSKTAVFWKELIKYSREKDPEFMWLAESSESWHDAIAPQSPFTSYDKLLEAGFDGYYGSFFNLKSWTTSKDLHKQISFTLGETKKFKEPKSVIGSFTTHDEVSPILLKGQPFSEMIIWLNSTLPVNSYYVDGFQTGDDYYYQKGNSQADVTYTDDDIYFTHKGQLDIFNFSRKPGGKYNEVKNNFILGNNVKNSILPVLNQGSYTPLKIKNQKVFGYMFSTPAKKVVTAGNLDFENSQKATLKVPGFNPKKHKLLPMKITTIPDIKGKKIVLHLNPGEIVVFILSNK